MRNYIKPVKLGILGGFIALTISTLSYYLFTHILSILEIKFENQSAITFLLNANTNVSTLIVFLISVIIIYPIAEELLFRGLLQTLVVKHLKNYIWGILITAILFSAAHLNLAAMPSLFLISLIFSETYRHGNSIISPIIAHIIFNSATSLIVLMSR